MALKDWSTTSADNNDADGDIDLEGSTASIRTADNSMRAIMGKMAIWRDDNNGSRSTAGSSNTYTYASAGAGATPADGFAAYATGDTLTIQANHTNTGAATLNVDSVGAKAIRKYANGAETNVAEGDIVSAAPFAVIYDADANSGAGAWILVSYPGLLSLTDAASQASMEAESGNGFVRPTTVKFSPGAAKGWGQANAAGTVNGSYNLTSVTDVGAGDIEFNWNIDFSSTTYAAVATVQNGAAVAITSTQTLSAGITRVKCWNTSGGAADPNLYCCVAFGDQ